MAPRASGNTWRCRIFNMDLLLSAQKELGIQAKIIQISPYKSTDILWLISGDFILLVVQGSEFTAH